MRRTENRPLPAGRLQPLEVLVFGILLGVGRRRLPRLDAADALRPPSSRRVTFVSYVGVYTPLKRGRR